jgi:hypothetical protein
MHPNCYGPSPRPDMTISSMSVEPERSQESDSMTIHRGSLVHGSGQPRHRGADRDLRA